MALTFQAASRKKTKLRMAIDGPAGSGKSFTALRFAFALGKKIAVIDTEAGSISKYQGDSPDGIPWNFDVVEFHRFSPLDYVEAIRSAAQGGYDVLVIDSLSHAWAGKGGALEQVDSAKAKGSKGGSDFFAWREVTPQHNELVESMIRAPMHVIATMRTKMEHVPEKDESGRTVIRKVGMAPVQRNGMEYEFDIVADMDWDHRMVISKSRCSAVADAIVMKPTAEFILPVKHWLESGAEVPQEVIDAARISYQQPAANGNGNGHEAPRKSLAEQMAEEKARRTAEAKSRMAEKPAEQPSAITQSAVDSRMEARTRDKATTDQVDAIKDCWRELEPLGIGQDKRASALKRRGVETESQLSIVQADELLARLRGEITRLSVDKLAEETIGTTAGN